MPTRYFKATDGANTYFRASPSRIYQSLSVTYGDWTMHWDTRGRFPAVEITRQEYKALVALKAARCERIKAEWIAAHPGEAAGHLGYIGTAPRDSWVSNDDLAVVHSNA